MTLRENMLRELHTTHLCKNEMQCTQPNVVAGDQRGRRALQWRVRNVCLAASPTTVTRVGLARRSPAPRSFRLHVGQRVYLVVVNTFSTWLDYLHMNNDTSTVQ